MNGGGRRQLPSWMLRPCTIEQTNISEVKEENNVNDPEELATVTSQTQKKVKQKKPKSGVPLVENESRIPKKCEGRTRDRVSDQEDEEQQENEPCMIKPCRTRKSKRMYERGKNQEYDLPQSNLETDDGPMRKKSRGNTLGKKKTYKSTEVSPDGTIPSEDELTVEDLVSIAEEYVKADLKETRKRQFESEMGSSIAEVESVKDLTAHMEDKKSHTYKPLSDESTSTDLLFGDGSTICPIYTGDLARDMLEVLLGGLLKKSEVEVESENDAITKNIMLNHDLCERSQNNAVAEVVPVTKKKASFKDKVAMLLE
ncbi:hypothetical protein RND81_14G003400 [Saponaria officinalis]|uniref:Uncharacterized protein n=1 Tax=Saponaria officinalis TaxID=3572 RepID=A0AAW1GQQ3_SAPOF